MPGFFIFIMVIMVVVAIVTNIKFHEANEARIREKLVQMGYVVERIERMAMSEMRFQSQHARAYRVVYTAPDGERHKVVCITGKHLGVFFRDGEPPQAHEPVQVNAAVEVEDRASEQVVRELRQEVENLRAVVDGLEIENAGLREELRKERGKVKPLF